MPYPTETPIAKHDLVMPRPFKIFLEQAAANEDLLGSDFSFPSTAKLFEDLETPLDPHQSRLICPFYSYSNAAQQVLYRYVVLVGVADTALSVVRKLIGDPDEVPDCLHKCTIAQKRADQENASLLTPEALASATAFAKIVKRFRQQDVVGVIGQYKKGYFGFLKPTEAPPSSEYTADDFVATCYLGKIEEVKAFLTQPATSIEEAPSVPTGETSFAETETSAPLWQPPTMESSDGMGFDNNGTSSFDAWQPSASETNVSGKKRSHAEMEQDNSSSEFHKDSSAAAADEFYSGLTRSLDTRADSWLFHMRAFNGWVKATQIQELNPRSKNKSNKLGGQMRVLDLACGKGGDIGKWAKHSRGVCNYVGVDVARGSLLDAAKRARKLKKLQNCTFTCADLGADVPGRLKSPKHKQMQKLLSWSRQNESNFEVDDPKFAMVRGGGISMGDKFDVVSIQFAIHYMMSSRKRARRFFQTVSELLEIGGLMIATTMDARVVMEHLLGLGLDLKSETDDFQDATIEVGGGACRIKVDGATIRKLFKGEKSDADMLGLQYTFTLVEGSDHAAGVGDAVNLAEWLAPIPLLKALADEAGLELESAENFHEFYANRRDSSSFLNAHNALYNMKVLDRKGSISKDEWEISRLYAALKFRKVRESTMVLEEEVVSEEELDEEEAVVEDHAVSKQDNDGWSTVETEMRPAVSDIMKAKAVLKVSRAVGKDAWGALSKEEKERLVAIELTKM